MGHPRLSRAVKQQIKTLIDQRELTLHQIAAVCGVGISSVNRQRDKNKLMPRNLSAERTRIKLVRCGDETARKRRKRRTREQMEADYQAVVEARMKRREDHKRKLHARDSDLPEWRPSKVISDGLPSDGPRISATCDPLLTALIAAHGQPRTDIAPDLLNHQMRYA